MTRIVTANEQTIVEAAVVLKQGGLVAMPTETVYGLAANALDGAAIAKIFEAKGRPQFNPLIIHCADFAEASQYVVMDERARALAQKFWPGPLTFILPRLNDKISELAGAGLPTLGVRVPNHPVAQRLIRAAGVPLAAPSANVSGTISPTTPQHVAESLSGKIDMILAAGACKVGLESTVLDLSGPVATVLRPGAITAEDIELVLKEKVASGFEGKSNDVKSPGQLLKHYAPNTKLRLKAIDVEPGEGLLAFGQERFMSVRGLGGVDKLADEAKRNLSPEGDLHQAAANLFAMLKDLDKGGFSSIAVMDIPEKGLGIAINDRLKRAAENNIK